MKWYIAILSFFLTSAFTTIYDVKNNYNEQCFEIHFSNNDNFSTKILDDTKHHIYENCYTKTPTYININNLSVNKECALLYTKDEFIILNSEVHAIIMIDCIR